MEEGAIIGTCMEMCPIQERMLREREGLLHRFEAYESTQQNKQHRKADPDKTIKCFSRSAAGVTTVQPDLLRPGPILLDTVRYLMKKIAPAINDRPLEVFEFISDRLRSVRQDMTIQRLPPDVCILILEPIIRFHVLYGYLLATNSRFESHLNNVNLQECLAIIFMCYQSVPDSEDQQRSTITSIFTCVTINKPESIVKHLNFKISPLCLELTVVWTLNNYVKIFNLASSLDFLARVALASHIPALRLKALRTICCAMSSSNSSFPVDRIARFLSYNKEIDVLEDCHRLGIRCSDMFCHFNKNDLLPSPLPQPQHWWVVDQELNNIDIATLLLGS